MRQTHQGIFEEEVQPAGREVSIVFSPVQTSTTAHQRCTKNLASDHALGLRKHFIAQALTSSTNPARNYMSHLVRCPASSSNRFG